MRNLALRWSSSELLMLLPLLALALLLSARQALGIQAGALWVMAAFFAAIAALVVVARHPAAFIAPVLFVPRLKEVSLLDKFGPLSGWTALHIACALLGAGVFLRWVAFPRRANANDAPARGNFVLPPSHGARLAGRTVLAFLVFGGVVAFSYLYTAAPHYGSEKLLAFATLGCGVFFAPWLLFTGDADVRDFIVGTVLFSLGVAASSLSFSASGAMGAEANPAHIGKGQVIGLAILLLVYAPIANRWLRLVVMVVLIPALAIGLVSAETRGPLFSLLMVLLLSFVLSSFRSPVVTRKQMAFVGVALVGAVMLLSVFWFYGKEAFRFEYKTAEIINLVEGDNEAQGTAVERLVFYRAALQLWTQRPLLGWGVGGWSMAYWHMDERVYPHNLFLEVLVEEGLVGELALFLFLAATFRTLRAHLDKTKARFPFLLPGLVYLISIAMFSGDLDDNRFIWFWCGLVLACCSLARRALQSGNDSQTAAPPRGLTPAVAFATPWNASGSFPEDRDPLCESGASAK